ncbi:hypothetical protein INR49_016105 [Caranx melampygus]|nr:hypothetical protein INR49_016105 [Caranx melampygus]
MDPVGITTRPQWPQGKQALKLVVAPKQQNPIVWSKHISLDVLMRLMFQVEAASKKFGQKRFLSPDPPERSPPHHHHHHHRPRFCTKASHSLQVHHLFTEDYKTLKPSPSLLEPMQSPP